MLFSWQLYNASRSAKSENHNDPYATAGLLLFTACLFSMVCCYNEYQKLQRRQYEEEAARQRFLANP